MRFFKKLSEKIARTAYRMGPVGSAYARLHHCLGMAKAQLWVYRTNKLVLSRLPRSSEFKRTDITVSNSIPINSWLIDIKENGICGAMLGSGVDTKNQSFFEGSWAGDFAKFDYSKSQYIFGSGASFSGTHITLTPSTHMYEGLYVLFDHIHRSVAASNSLAFLLESKKEIFSNTDLENIFHHSHTINHRMTKRGMFRYNPIAFKDKKHTILFLYGHDLCLEPGRSPKIKPRMNARYFIGFDDYKSHVKAALTAIIENGRHPARKKPLQPLTTVSRGYDSPAVAALVADCGCKNAVTIALQLKDHDDDGSQIARHLGLICEQCSHPAGQKLKTLNFDFSGDLLEKSMEFIGTVGLGDDIILSAFDARLSQTVLLSGALGDSIWGKESAMPIGLPVRVRYGKSITEYRLRKGYSFVPVPTIGAQFPASIARISNLNAMKKWSVGGDYDRPIARRIAEERGVPRDAFGTKKGAVNPHPLNFAAHKPEAFKRMMTRYSVR